ncbi:hypothetical protein EJ06DRAFT_483971 [Trichodelitschia bisporula]|uniref:Transmembrane protein 135 N-terminal domain-containing protein n=1 Tax=Trichodelitschia bisporula TaxID=703511 RepID=A0A6G1HJB4_9PEZI|nr:hypothetical protein EJ06DRAFT_483971 [Trichodelitschia bisporula]
MDPIVRNAMRYSLSPREYKLLHKYLLSRTPAVRTKAPQPARFERAVTAADDYNAAALRASVRLFGGVYGGLKLWEVIAARVLGRKPVPAPKQPFYKSGNIRLPGALAAILLFHRLLHRFFLRLRASLLDDTAKAFRARNPRIARALTAKLAPALGASLAGAWLAAYPASQLRITITIYTASRALEFFYEYLHNGGWFANMPWWVGSWLLMPAACGQLLHAFVFDRDCFPATYNNFVLRHSQHYLHARPAGYPATAPWPSAAEIVDNLAEMARLRWPPFVSPILFPTSQTLPPTLAALGPLTSSAHPGTTSLSCATLHPNDPSCLRTYATFFLRAFPGVARFFTLLYGAFSLLRWRAFVKTPGPAFLRLARTVLRMALYVTGALGTSWASICAFQAFLPRNVLPQGRFVAAGALAGSWAFLDRGAGRGNFMYTARMSADSLWKVGRKRGWWNGVRGGDVLLFVGSLALLGGVYEADPAAVTSGVIRKGFGVLRGEGWVDRLEAPKATEEKVVPDGDKGKGKAE